MMEHYDKIRIVVVGDSGVGKTSLVHILCHNEVLRHPTWTIGCSVDVKMHTHSRTNKTYFVEFIDVGGSSKHKSSRNMFYQQVNGIMLVHDVSNRKSYHNLWRWIAEVINSEAYKENEKANSIGSNYNANWGTGSGSGSGSWMSGNGSMSVGGNDYDFELHIGERHASVPILVVGTKADLFKQELTGRQRRYSIVDEYGGECVNVCTLASTHFAQNSNAAQKIEVFFDKVIDKKFGTTAEYLQSPTYGSFTMSSSYPSVLTNREERRRVVPNGSIIGTSSNIIPNGIPSPGLPGYITSNTISNVNTRAGGSTKDISTKKQSWNGFRNPVTHSSQTIDDSSSSLRSSNNSRESLSSFRIPNSSTSSISRSSSTTNLRESINGNASTLRHSISNSNMRQYNGNGPQPRRASLRPYD